jgi:hypothetical protein
LFHFLTLPAFLGLWLFRRRFVEVPGAWLLAATGGLLVLLLYWLGVSNGYVGERHVMLIVIGGLYFAVATVAVLSSWLARAISRWRPNLSGSTVSLLVLLLLTTLPLSKTLARMHADRRGFKEAGLWLAKNAAPGETIIDPFAWAGYYAGRRYQPDTQSVAPGWCYIILERSDNDHPHLRYLLNHLDKIVQDQAPVKSFPMARRRSPGSVVVYHVKLKEEDRVVR